MEKITKPKNEKGGIGGQEKANERIAELGYKTLEKEVGIKMPPHRKAGFMLTTFLATGLTLFSPGRAGSQLRIGGRDLGGSIARSVLTAGKNAFEMSQNKKIEQIHAEYQEKLGALLEAEGQVDQEYHQYKLKLREEDNEEALRQLEEDYHQEKIKMTQARIRLDRERDAKLAKTKIIRDAVGSGVRTIREH